MCTYETINADLSYGKVIGNYPAGKKFSFTQRFTQRFTYIFTVDFIYSNKHSLYSDEVKHSKSDRNIARALDNHDI